MGKLSASLDGLQFPYQLNVDLLGTEGAIRDNRVYSKTLFPSRRISSPSLRLRRIQGQSAITLSRRRSITWRKISCAARRSSRTSWTPAIPWRW